MKRVILFYLYSLGIVTLIFTFSAKPGFAYLECDAASGTDCGSTCAAATGDSRGICKPVGCGQNTGPVTEDHPTGRYCVQQCDTVCPTDYYGAGFSFHCPNCANPGYCPDHYAPVPDPTIPPPGSCDSGCHVVANPDAGQGNCRGDRPIRTGITVCNSSGVDVNCGPDQCEPIPPPEPGHHSECSNNQCIVVEDTAGGDNGSKCRVDSNDCAAGPPRPPVSVPTIAQVTTTVAPPQLTGQQFICLDTEPCSSTSVTCTDESPANVHRVKLSTTGLTSANSMWIFECLNEASGFVCTSGIDSVDNAILNTHPLTDPLPGYGYKFNGFYRIDKNQAIKIDQQPASSQIKINETYEWDSNTTNNTGRIFVGIKLINSSDQKTSQKIGTFAFDNYCNMITWDPYGKVFDTHTLQPVSNVKITLLKKTTEGQFEIMTDKDVFGGITNPFVTTNNGNYNFRVPDGTYKLKIDHPDYRLDISSEKYISKDQLSHIYYGQEITQEGKPIHMDIPLENIGMCAILDIPSLVCIEKRSH